MPILFALYRVINSVPAYVTKVKETFAVLANKIIASENGFETFKAMKDGNIANTIATYGNNMVEGNEVNGVIDVLNKLSSTDMEIVSQKFGLENLQYQGQLILGEGGLLNEYNQFLGLNIANSPQVIMKTAFAVGAWGLVIGALLIPILSALTQWINTKLMPASNSNDQDNPMASSMKTMNMIMPLMSAWFCFAFPCGMGIYWIAGSVVRSIQQIAINKHFDKMNFEDIIKQNAEKSKKKMEKLEKQQEMLNAYANMKTKSIQSIANMGSNNTNNSNDNYSSTNYSSNYKPGSMMAKANMVKEFNEKNNRE
jgi:YidC/Oxa1 family membrane protein insertase